MFLLLCRSGRSIDQTDDDDDDDDRIDRHVHIHNSLLDALLCYDGVTKNENENAMKKKKGEFLITRTYKLM